jgi:anaerobic magnesium-protoporphyrin IX monomethyl ester cyclase
VNYVFGLRRESVRTLRRALRCVVDLDADFVNALYFTPHGWTQDGRRLDPARIIQLDQRRWCYRNQVVEAGLGPGRLFLWVKAIEAAAHLRPRWLARLFSRRFPETGRLRRWCFPRVSLVWLYELWDQLVHIRFRRPGPVSTDAAARLLPGQGPAKPQRGGQSAKPSEEGPGRV